jgi:predicted metal-binding protein
MLMTIDILYFEGCPNHAPTVERVREVVRDLHANAVLREIEVKDAEDAARLRFFGSPTVQIDGEDIDPAVRGRLDYSFSCRMYGKAGTPSRELLEHAVRARMGA